jgi:hypothetical protein
MASNDPRWCVDDMLSGCFVGYGQTSATPKPQMAEDVFKDVKVLKGIPVDQFMDTMGFFAASLSFNCTDCHGLASSGDWARYADENANKTTARKMILMVRSINQANFGGTAVVTCHTCHRDEQDPKPLPSFAEQYSTNPLPDDPDQVVIGSQGKNGPTSDKIFDKYLQAIGGAQRVAALTSYTAKGLYNGWDTSHAKVPVEIFAKSPNQRATVVHTLDGDSVRTFDGTAGWIAAPDKPVPLMPLTGGDLYGAKVDAMLFFPADVKQIATQWRVGSATIGDDDVEVVQGITQGQLPVKLYFDPKSGLLLREVRLTRTIVGQNPTEITFEDYRDVAGVKIPFKWTVTWTDGQATVELNSVQPNVSIDPAKLSKPAPFSPPKSQTH